MQKQPAFSYAQRLAALSCVTKPDRSEHEVQRSKAKSRKKPDYGIQVLLSKTTELLNTLFLGKQVGSIQDHAVPLSALLRARFPLDLRVQPVIRLAVAGCRNKLL
ncbi:hypothetical protein [Pedobacter suwonensis]|uniref:hypothetical protein n=1 Tax=Pedobacter suwonensis TaxID=332999 RepID=UPI0011A85136|nr:hypothetical protein [Pedobacter suwonensis]